MKLTKEEADILCGIVDIVDKFYQDQENICRQFKWICHDHLPQHGPEYVKNKNVFEIQDKTIKDIQAKRTATRELLVKLANS